MLLATAILVVFLVGLFAAIVGCQLLGFRTARQRRSVGSTGFGKGTTAVTGSLFALLGLLVAFSISGGETTRADRPSMHVSAFAATLALTTYVIVNIELPRLGIAGLGPIDALLAQVRERMG